MHEETIDIATAEGKMETFLVLPDAPAPPPVVVVLMDAPGIREELRALARDFAGRGFCTLLPDLYYRSGKLRFPVPLSPADRHRIERARRELTLDRFAGDAAAILGYIAARRGVDRDRVAFVGFCIGSGFVLAAIAALGDAIAAAALIDGCELGDRIGSEPRFTPPVGTGVYVALPSAMPSRFAGEMLRLVESGGMSPRTETVRDTRHGFCFRDWPAGVYDERARRAVLDRVARFLEESFEQRGPCGS